MKDQSPLDLERLLQEAITQAVTHEDPDAFQAWFREHLSDYLTDSAPKDFLDPPFTATLARSIWNALPLPGNGFKPSPLPEPGRNDPCYCGSGEKYKRCCAGRQTIPLEPDHVLPTVLDRTPPETLKAHIQAGRVPVQPLVELARTRYQRGELWNAVDLLEPLFEDIPAKPGVPHGEALELLCDLYMALGHEARRDALLDRITTTDAASPLRAVAWQRIAVTRLDQGDVDAAWAAFHRAQSDEPEAPGIGLLEIQLLMSRGRAEQAGRRAAHWEKTLRAQGYTEAHRLLTFFTQMSEDPWTVMANMGTQAAGGAGTGLLNWLKQVKDRPVPDYEIQPAPDSAASPKQVRLTPPEPVQTTETRWHEAYPQGKPAEIDALPDDQTDPWDPTTEKEWTDFLENHPEAFDSLDILDDLATAVIQHPQFGATWLDHTMLEPVLTRAESIIRETLGDTTTSQLSTTNPDHHIPIRCLARLADVRTRQTERPETLH